MVVKSIDDQPANRTHCEADGHGLHCCNQHLSKSCGWFCERPGTPTSGKWETVKCSESRKHIGDEKAEVCVGDFFRIHLGQTVAAEVRPGSTPEISYQIAQKTSPPLSQERCPGRGTSRQNICTYAQASPAPREAGRPRPRGPSPASLRVTNISGEGNEECFIRIARSRGCSPGRFL